MGVVVVPHGSASSSYFVLPRLIFRDGYDPTFQSRRARTAGSHITKLIVSCFYPELIPTEILDLAPGINVHPSDLPQWRGPDPITHTILSGQSESAVCVHALTEALDAGDIYLRHSVEIGPKEDVGPTVSTPRNLGC